MVAVPKNNDSSFAAVSSEEDGSGENKKPSNRFLFWMWVAAIPLSFLGMILTWSFYNPLSPDQGIIKHLSILATLLPSAIPTVISKIFGIVAIWRKWHGDMWENQPPLLQAAGIFTVSFAICWLLLVVGVSLGAVPVPQKFDFFLFEWLISAFFHMYFGLSVCFALFAYVALIPPIILCTLIIYNKKVSMRTIRILAAISTFGWMIISFIGMIMSVA